MVLTDVEPNVYPGVLVFPGQASFGFLEHHLFDMAHVFALLIGTRTYEVFGGNPGACRTRRGRRVPFVSCFVVTQPYVLFSSPNCELFIFANYPTRNLPSTLNTVWCIYRICLLYNFGYRIEAFGIIVRSNHYQ